MNLKSVYILFGIWVAVLLAFALTQLLGLKKPSTEGDWVLPALHAGKNPVKSSEITRVELDRSIPGTDRRETLVFVRGSSGWELQEPHKLRVQSYLVDNLVDQVLRARREKSEITHNLADLGLVNPGVVVTLSKGEEQSWQLNVARPESKVSGSVVYAQAAARPKDPMAVKYTDLENLFKSLNDFRERGLISASTFTTTAVDLKGPKGAEVGLEKTADNLWRFQKPPYGPAEFEGETSSPAVAAVKNVTGVKDLLDAVTGLKVESDADFVAEGVSDQDLAGKYGLASDKPDSLRIQARIERLGSKSEEKTTETLLIGKKVEAKEEKKTDKKDDKKDDKKEKSEPYYYARMDGESAVVRVPEAKVEPLLKVLAAPDVLRDRSLVQADSTRKDLIDAVNLQNSTGLVKLRKPEGTGDWKVYRDGTSQATEFGSVRDLIDALTEKKQVKTFVDKEDGLGFDKPLAVVSLWYEGVQKEEKKEDKKDEKKEEKKEEKKDATEPKLKSDKPGAALTFGKRDRDKSLVYVRREAGPDRTVVTVADSLLDRVTVGPLAFLERKLPRFAEEGSGAVQNVTKFVLNRGGQSWELAREKTGDKAVWKFVQPKTLAGRMASELNVDEAIRDLAGLQPSKLVAEKPPETDLDQLYGLKSPALKATVTVSREGKSEDWVYAFGKETDDKAGLFGKQSQRDLVFVVPKDRIKALEADLRDPTVLSFELAKVKAVKLSGWKESAGRVDTLEVEHKGDKQWQVRIPAGFNVNPDVLEGFFKTLTTLRAERFVVPKPGAKTGLDVNEGALQVEITVDGTAKPLALTIGAEDPDSKGFYFARSSRFESDLFLLPKAHYEKAKERMAYFAKK
jgi:hypothetical protein